MFWRVARGDMTRTRTRTRTRTCKPQATTVKTFACAPATSLTSSPALQYPTFFSDILSKKQTNTIIRRPSVTLEPLNEDVLADLQSVTLDEAEPGPHVFDELQTHLFGKQANKSHRRVDAHRPI